MIGPSRKAEAWAVLIWSAVALSAVSLIVRPMFDSPFSEVRRHRQNIGASSAKNQAHAMSSFN